MRAQHLKFEGPTRGELMLAAWVELGWTRQHEGLTREAADAKISKLKLERGQYKLSHRIEGKQEVWSIWRIKKPQESTISNSDKTAGVQLPAQAEDDTRPDR